MTEYSFSAALFNFDVRDLVQILRQTAAVTDATWPKRNLGCGLLVDFMLLYLLQFVSSNFWWYSTVQCHMILISVIFTNLGTRWYSTSFFGLLSLSYKVSYYSSYSSSVIIPSSVSSWRMCTYSNDHHYHHVSSSVRLHYSPTRHLTSILPPLPFSCQHHPHNHNHYLLCL